jgi:hypothetical protein
MHLTPCLDPPSAVGWLPGKVEYCRSPTSTKDCSRSSRRAGRQAHREDRALARLACHSHWLWIEFWDYDDKSEFEPRLRR